MNPKKIKIIFTMPTLLIFGFTFFIVLFFQINQTNAISCSWKNGCSYGEYIHGTPSGSCITIPKPSPSNLCCCNEATGASLPTPAIDCSTMLVTDINYFLCLPPSTTTESTPKGSSRSFELDSNTPKLQIPSLNVNFSEKICKIENGKNVCSIAWIGEYIAAIYKYAIGIVGILAAVVLMIGGVMWIIAGGSATMIGEAKAWIGASLTGLVIALCSYLILFQINPALTVFAPLGITQVAKAPEAPIAGGCQWGEKDVLSCSSGYDETSDISKCPTGGKPFEQFCCCPTTISVGGCSSTDTGYCAANNFSNWGDLASKASAVCMGESSNQCVCNTDTYSCGPMQIHLFSGGVIVNGVDCKNYYYKIGPGDPAKYGYNWTQYGIVAGKTAEAEACKQKTCDINFFPAFAYQKYTSQGWGAWSITLSGQKCYALTHQ